jgi:hypothetical protein
MFSHPVHVSAPQTAGSAKCIGAVNQSLPTFRHSVSNVSYVIISRSKIFTPIHELGSENYKVKFTFALKRG